MLQPFFKSFFVSCDFWVHSLILYYKLISVFLASKLIFPQCTLLSLYIVPVFSLFLKSFVHFSLSITLSSSSLIHYYLALDSILLTLIILCHVLVLVFFLSLCFPDVLNPLRWLWRLSWWTTHRMKAQLHKRTTREAKYVLFNSWKYVSTVRRMYSSISVLDPRSINSCFVVVENITVEVEVVKPVRLIELNPASSVVTSSSGWNRLRNLSYVCFSELFVIVSDVEKNPWWWLPRRTHIMIGVLNRCMDLQRNVTGIVLRFRLYVYSPRLKKKKS